MPGKSPDKRADRQREARSLVRSVLKLPRITRLVIAGVLALAVTLALSPIIDEIYLRFFFDESTRGLPGLLAAAFGVTMYIIGWFAIVGTSGEAAQERQIAAYYLVVGLLAIGVVLIWLIRLLLISSGA
ncbi:MAG: hypothetical protein ACOCX3_01205 [Chloroflexota bacterium]